MKLKEPTIEQELEKRMSYMKYFTYLVSPLSLYFGGITASDDLWGFFFPLVIEQPTETGGK